MPSRQIYGNEIHYETAGDGEPLVLLHGLGSSARDWEAQIPVFAQGYRVIAPDFRGFGSSAKLAGSISVSNLAHDIRGLLDALSIDRCHLMGFSMGGAVAYQMALDHPERFENLVILNSISSFKPVDLRGHFEYLSRKILVRLFGMKPLAKLVSKRLFPLPEQNGLRTEMAARYANNDRGSYLAALDALAAWDVSDRLGEITTPTLVISADQDYTAIELKQADVDRLPNATLEVISDSRHGTPMDQAEALNRAVLGFLGHAGG